MLGLKAISCWEGAHGTRQISPQPIGFRFRFIPRKVPGLSANPLGFRGGGGAAMQEREPSPPPAHPKPRVLPRRRAHQAHAPLRFQTRSFVPLSSTSSSSSPSSSSSVCLFFCGGLGVGEKPARGELVRSTRSQACGAWGLARRAEPTRRAKKENFSGAVATAPHQRVHQVSRPR